MSQSTQPSVAVSSQGLFLVQKAPLNRVAARYPGKRPGPVLVTWTSEPKPQPKKGERAMFLLAMIAAPSDGSATPSSPVIAANQSRQNCET